MTYLRWWTLEGSEMAVFVVAYARCPGVCVCVCVCVCIHIQYDCV